MWLAVVALACSSPASAPVPEAPAPASPPGRIGGEPILPHLSVIGAIPDAQVEAGIAEKRDAIVGCWRDRAAERPDLKGKILVYFAIDADGAVKSAKTVSTSLRDPPTEECVAARVAEAHFPPLQRGRTAVVNYPFVFPPVP